MKDKDVGRKIDDLAQMVAEGFKELRQGLKGDINELREEMATKANLAELREEMATKADLLHLRGDITSCSTDTSARQQPQAR